MDIDKARADALKVLHDHILYGAVSLNRDRLDAAIALLEHTRPNASQPDAEYRAMLQEWKHRELAFQVRKQEASMQAQAVQAEIVAQDMRSEQWIRNPIKPNEWSKECPHCQQVIVMHVRDEMPHRCPACGDKLDAVQADAATHIQIPEFTKTIYARSTGLCPHCYSSLGMGDTYIVPERCPACEKVIG